MVFSSVVILFNKWILSSAGFPYPVLLTTWHLVVATLLTQLLARTTSLLDGRKLTRMTPRLYWSAIVPIGVFYSLSLACSNLVYLYLSVAFTQMLKAAAPATVLFTSWIFGVAKPNLAVLTNILIIVAGVAIASYGEIEFDIRGFFYQVGGLVFESIRLVLVQKLLAGTSSASSASKTSRNSASLSKEDLEEGDESGTNETTVQGPVKMDPLVSLYYFAPVCAVMNFLVALVMEIPSFEVESLSKVGAFALSANAAVAFFLNIASLLLIGKTSSLVLTLCGVLKNILIIFSSVLIWNTPITPLQYLGYGIALVALTYYSVRWDDIVKVLPILDGMLTSPTTSKKWWRVVALVVLMVMAGMLWSVWSAERLEATTVR